MIDLPNFFNEIGADAVERLKKQLEIDDKVVTGATKDSIRYVITDRGIEVLGKASILTLITGRKATTDKSGDGQLLKNIKIWAKKRGLGEAAAYAITKKIHEDGIKVPNQYTDGRLLYKAFEGLEKDIIEKWRLLYK